MARLKDAQRWGNLWCCPGEAKTDKDRSILPWPYGGAEHLLDQYWVRFYFWEIIREYVSINFSFTPIALTARSEHEKSFQIELRMENPSVWIIAGARNGNVRSPLFRNLGKLFPSK